MVLGTVRMTVAYNALTHCQTECVKQLFHLRGVAFSLHSSAVEAGTGKATAHI